MGDTPMREAMRAQRLSFRDLGFLTECDAGYLCRIANGGRRPSRVVALRISKVLGLDPATLVEAA